MSFPSAYSSSVGTHPGQDTLPSLGALTHPPAHSAWDNVDTPFTSHAHLWGGGGNQGPGRKRTQTWGEHANSPQTVAPARNRFFFFLINIITKGPWMKRRYLSTCCALACGYCWVPSQRWPALQASATGRLALR